MKTYLVCLEPKSCEGFCFNFKVNVNSRKEAISSGRDMAKTEPGYRFSFVRLVK